MVRQVVRDVTFRDLGFKYCVLKFMLVRDRNGARGTGRKVAGSIPDGIVSNF